MFREEWEWLHKNSINNNDETIISTTENESDENGLSLFKIQFQEAAKDLCLMLSKSFFVLEILNKIILFKIFLKDIFPIVVSMMPK